MSMNPARVVSSRLRVIQKDFLTRRGGRVNAIRSSTAISYTPAYMSPYNADIHKCPRLIDAEVVHGDEQSFWTARRDFYRGGSGRSFYPLWDRQAQVLIMLTRAVPRVPQEAAFRLFAMGLKMMLLPRVVAGTELMLPAWLSMNMKGLLGETSVGKGEAGKEEDRVTSGEGAAPGDVEEKP